MQAEQPTLLFQGMANKNVVFTRDVDLAYPKLNQTYIDVTLTPNPNEGRINELIGELSIQTDAQFKAALGYWAPPAEVELRFSTKLPNSNDFQLRIDDQAWKTISDSAFHWSLHPGNNRVDVRPVDVQGLVGPTTYLELRYE